jgi:hypothetical protein
VYRLDSVWAEENGDCESDSNKLLEENGDVDLLEDIVCVEN